MGEISKLKNNSIKSKMLMAMGAFCLIIVVQLVVSYYGIQRIREVDELKDRIHDIEVKAYDIRNNNLNYFNHESQNADYFSTGRSEYLWKTKRLYKEVKEELADLMQNDQIQRMDITRYIKTARISFYKYQSYFHEIEVKLLAKGFQDYGLEGKMKKELDGLKSMNTISAENLLRIEKLEMEYILKGDKNMASKAIALARELAEKSDEQTKNYLLNYASFFDKYVEYTSLIGFNNNSGLKKALFTEASRLDKELMKLTVKFDKHHQNEMALLTGVLLLSAILIILLSIWLSLVFSRNLSSPIIKLVDKIKSTTTTNFRRGHRLGKNTPSEILMLDNEFTNMLTKIREQVDEISSKKAELEGQNEKLIQLNKELDRFIYHTSHDLRAPLTSISGLIEVVEGAEEEDISEYIEHMKFCINQLDHTIVEIIHFYKNKSSEIREERVDLFKVVNTIYDQNRFHPNAAGIRLETNLQEGIMVKTDSYRLNIILGNLITNAIKYHDGKKEDRFIKTSLLNTGKRWVVEVQDNGLGIPRQHLEKIFTMFYRASQLSTGSGLGLYIVSESVRKMGAKIEVESDEGEGTLFRITLPDGAVSFQEFDRIETVQN